MLRAILVDSTRSGKRIPDSLSKTVSIWCAVINRAVLLKYHKGGGWDTNLYTPPSAVSIQEHRQIEAHLDEWVKSLVVGFSNLFLSYAKKTAIGIILCDT
jgi:tRNA A64-2'-O-ribosylphosphate transferase